MFLYQLKFWIFHVFENFINSIDFFFFFLLALINNLIIYIESENFKDFTIKYSKR